MFLCLYVYDMFHILLSCDSLRDLWNAYMYVCMYVCMSGSGNYKERLALSKQAAQKFDVEKCYLRKLNEL